MVDSGGERSDYSEAVVLKVSQAVSAPLSEIHLSIDALGDAVVIGEAPHGRDFTFTPLFFANQDSSRVFAAFQDRGSPPRRPSRRHSGR